MWASVRHGEEKHIFPYQENADVMFNSSLFYEISVLRALAEPVLREVPDTVPEYAEAKRMLKFLDNFVPIAPDEIPPTSLLRERRKSPTKKPPEKLRRPSIDWAVPEISQRVTLS